MATWLTARLLDGMLNGIKSDATDVRIIDDYTPGDDYATVVGNSLAAAAVSSTDFDDPQPVGSLRRMTFLGKTMVASAPTSALNLHIALTDSANSDVLVVTDEVTDQPFDTGAPITVPSFFIQVTQPTQL